jgi:hypothetical protein
MESAAPYQGCLRVVAANAARALVPQNQLPLATASKLCAVNRFAFGRRDYFMGSVDRSDTCTSSK